MKKTVILLIIILPLLITFDAIASQPYNGYNYNSWGTSVPAPNSYSATKIIDNLSLGIESISNPSDMIYANEKLYVLDSGNGRVLVLDKDYNLEREINEFISFDGEKVELQNPQSLYVDVNDDLIIADTDAKRVLVCDMDGKIKRTLKRPDSDIFPENLEFKPEKVIADKQGNIYVLCTGFYYGAIIYDARDNFTGFFGANLVDVSLAQLSDMFWRVLMTSTQKSYVAKYVPVDYTSMDIDDEDFIYTCSRTSNSRNEIKKLNPLGTNILQAEITYDPLNKSDYGDLEKLWYNGIFIDTSFTDINISERGIINALDFTYGRVFQYDQDSNLLSTFGGLGSQKGFFKMPVAVVSVEDDVLVLDADKGNITIFSLTEYGRLVLEATLLYNEGMYKEAMSNWEDVLKQNYNSELAYRGIGRAYLQQDDYESALHYLKLGQDRAGYSKAYGYYRSKVVRNNFPLIAPLLIILTLFILFWDKIRKVLKKYLPQKNKVKKYVNPFGVIFHPIDTMEEIRLNNGKAQMIISSAIIAFWFVISIIERQGTGFVFNLNKPEGLNLWIMAAKTAGIFILFILCSWAVGSLNEGEASLPKLFNVTACALLPYTLGILIRTFLSNYVTYEEGTLLKWALVVVLIYSLLLIFMGNMKAHQYTTGKTFASLLISLVSMIIAAFVMVLIFSLVQQLTIFILTLYNEILFRI